MKIGIVTIRAAENHGQRLQNFALHTVLTQMGNNVETIENYYDVDYDERAPWPSLRTAYRMVRYAHWPVRRAMADWKRRAAFRRFNKKIPIGPWAWKNEEVDLELPNCWNDRYDAFVAGSDQVWNTTFGTTSPLNFLSFAEKDKRLSYAAGVCVDAKELSKHDWAVKGLKEMRWLSVREVQSAKEVEKVTGRKASIDLDPTLLFEGSQWEKLLKLPKQKPKRKKYLLLYTLSKHSDSLVTWAKDMAGRKGWKIIELKNWQEPAYQKGPEEFVRLIRDAQFVATDSFHGTVFSLLMRTPFAIAGRSGELEQKMNDRLVTLLQQADIEERTYDRLTEQTLFSLDFDKAERNFAHLRQQSIQNLWNSLRPRRKECGQKPLLAPVQLCTGCATQAAQFMLFPCGLIKRAFCSRRSISRNV